MSASSVRDPRVVPGTALARRGIHTLIPESGEGLTSWLTDSRLQSLAEYEYAGDTYYPLRRTASRPHRNS